MTIRKPSSHSRIPPTPTTAVGLLLAAALLPAFPPPAPADPSPATQPASQPSPRDEQMARRLLGESPAQGPAPFQRAVELMQTSAEQLAERHNTSTQTQQTQAQILKALDDAIRQAESQLSQKSGAQDQRAESRRAGRRSPRRAGDGQSTAADRPGRQPGATGQPGKGGAAASSRPGDSDEVRRGWGYLPQRDREAVVQGAREEFLSRYRSHIERYYRAIAERAEADR